MIPLHKLKRLPRSQRLRKAAKIAGETEQRFIVSGLLPPEEAEYLRAMLEVLIEEEGFSPTTTMALKNARTDLRPADTDYKRFHRALDTVYHLLLTETGRYQADWDFIEAGDTLDPSKRHIFPGLQVYLEDIRSPFNVGSMFRAAESFGVEKIWLSPLCADPRHKRAERTAMGCIDILPWQRLNHDPFSGSEGSVLTNSSNSLSVFSDGPFFALETGGIPLSDFPFPSSGIMIVGSEELGVSPQALAAADASLGRVTIPVYGAKGSLNVSVAFGIVMQAWAVQLAKQ